MFAAKQEGLNGREEGREGESGRGREGGSEFQNAL